jgi:glycine oxidase
LLIPILEDDAVNHREAALKWSGRFGWPVEELDSGKARAVEPALTDDVSGALLWPQVAQVRNPRLMQAVVRALRQAGVEIREQAEVAGLAERNGRISGLRLGDGEILDADAVLLAAGSWSGELAGRIGFDLPVRPVKGQILLLRAEPGRLRHIVKHDLAYFVPRSDGRVLVGASMENVGFRYGNTVAVIHQLMQALMRLTPGLADAEVERQWMGFRPGSPDGLPFLGPVRERPGLWVASGHYRNGVALAPVTADIMSSWILGEPPDFDMSPFLPERRIQQSAQLGFPEA